MELSKCIIKSWQRNSYKGKIQVVPHSTQVPHDVVRSSSGVEIGLPELMDVNTCLSYDHVTVTVFITSWKHINSQIHMYTLAYTHTRTHYLFNRHTKECSETKHYLYIIKYNGQSASIASNHQKYFIRYHAVPYHTII